MPVYSFSVLDGEGHEKALSDYRGKALLIVNTASQCGLTPQYAGLQELYAAWQAKGLEVLAFPCDQFGHQEPGSNAEIQQFCQTNFGVTFPVFARIEVNGKDCDRLYEYLRATQPGPQGGDIQWNFTKFLIGLDGTVVERFEPVVKPEDIAPAIEKLLG